MFVPGELVFCPLFAGLLLLLSSFGFSLCEFSTTNCGSSQSIEWASVCVCVCVVLGWHENQCY